VQSDWQLPYTITDEYVVYADTRGTFMRYSDGSEQALLNGGRSFPPVVTEDRIYATNLQGDLLAWNRNDHQLSWQLQFEGWVFPPLVIEGSLFVGGQEHVLYRIDAGTGVIEESVALDNEAIFSPVEWRSGTIAVGVYARSWQVIGLNPLRLIRRINVPQPPLTATRDGYFLAQTGALFRQLPDGSFKQAVAAQGFVRWLDFRQGQLHWSTGRRLWRVGDDGIECLVSMQDINHPNYFVREQKAQPTVINETPRLIAFLDTDSWGSLSDDQQKQENSDENNMDRLDRDTDQHPVDRRTCRTLRR
jgi:outer membrane protein assembly factor BamB